ncbi:acyl-CoA synthetase [Kyrpidia spormannii]|uniref:AMP-dependent synthetase n=1 Tax=Kyrpidia spormannii TaxID=2055160 RepID=A0A6F9EI12_9BACL|nr:acyl-CoA synthetase [Kyrpidia spormannii]CAB3396057.1 AMP-dependent synthetase [Kyrpidia spormannii]
MLSYYRDDFWATTSAHPMSYEEIDRKFVWDVPERFNIGQEVCTRHASKRGQLALVYDRGDGHHEKWTFWEMEQTSNRLANALRGLGVDRGDRVAVFLSQCPELPIAHIAAYKLGAIVVPLFTLFGPEAFVYRLNDGEAKVLITDHEHVGVVMDHQTEMPGLKRIIVTDGRVPGTTFWGDLLSAASPEFDVFPTRADDPAIIIYTSGTTGAPKGALHAHRMLLGHLPGVSLSHDLMPAPGDFIWTPADWAWIGGMYDVLFPALYWGVPVLARRMPKFDPEEAFALMAKWGVRNVFFPPTALKMMRGVTNPRDRWNLDLRTVASGGEPLGEQTMEWGREALGLTINEFYGQTECNLVLTNAGKLYPPTPNSAGRPVPGHVVRIIDENGTEIPPGEVGEIAVRRPDPVMFLEYWKRPEATARKFVGDWLRTGDLGYRDENGNFIFIGRDDDIISSAGYRIGPAEIEEVLVKHPSVLMAAVVGTPDPVRGQAVKAFIKLSDPAQAGPALVRELQDWVKTRLAAYEYPREIEFVESFPMTPSGKIQRQVLRKQEEAKKRQ